MALMGAYLRFTADRGDSPSALEVRLLELRVKADAFSEPPPAAAAEVEPAMNWRSWALLAFVPLALAAGWMALRQRWRQWARPPG